LALPHSHTPLLVHVRFAPHVCPSQQTSPADSPHGSHVGPEPPATQTLPVVHAGEQTGPASTTTSGPASLDPSAPGASPPVVESEPVSLSLPLLLDPPDDPDEVSVAIVASSPIAPSPPAPSPVVASSVGSMTPVLGAPGGGDAVSIVPVTSLGFAQ
jgi:hypothetical protein